MGSKKSGELPMPFQVGFIPVLVLTSGLLGYSEPYVNKHFAI